MAKAPHVASRGMPETPPSDRQIATNPATAPRPAKNCWAKDPSGCEQALVCLPWRQSRDKAQPATGHVHCPWHRKPSRRKSEDSGRKASHGMHQWSDVRRPPWLSTGPTDVRQPSRTMARTLSGETYGWSRAPPRSRNGCTRNDARTATSSAASQRASHSTEFAAWAASVEALPNADPHRPTPGRWRQAYSVSPQRCNHPTRQKPTKRQKVEPVQRPGPPPHQRRS